MSQDSPTADDLRALRDLKVRADACGVSLVMIGAGARLLTFDQRLNIPSHRTTTDWDFGARVSDWAAFHALHAELVKHDFEGTARPHVVIHKATGVRVDLVPYGGVIEGDELRWPSSDVTMNMAGFSEAFEHAVDVMLDPGLQVQVATPPVLAMLKCFSFMDRSGRTLDDFRDLVFMAERYLSAGQEGRMFEEPFASVITEERFDWRYGGPLLLGYDMARVCQRKTASKLLPIMRTLSDVDHPRLGDFFRRVGDEAEVEQRRCHVRALFEWMERGLTI